LEPRSKLGQCLVSIGCDGHDLDERFDVRALVPAHARIADDLELGVRLWAGPAHVIAVTIGSGTTKCAQCHHLRVRRGDTQNSRMTATHHELHPAGGQLIQAGIDQLHVASVRGDGVPVEQSRDGFDEFLETASPISRRWTLGAAGLHSPMV